MRQYIRIALSNTPIINYCGQYIRISHFPGISANNSLQMICVFFMHYNNYFIPNFSYFDINTTLNRKWIASIFNFFRSTIFCPVPACWFSQSLPPLKCVFLPIFPAASVSGPISVVAPWTPGAQAAATKAYRRPEAIEIRADLCRSLDARIWTPKSWYKLQTTTAPELLV